MQRISGIAMLIILLGCSGQLLAQTMDSNIGVSKSGASSAAYYFISKPGEITMSVNLWGHVRNPGRYEVPISTDIVQLISYAGGPSSEADLGTVKIARVVRGVDAIRTVEFDVSLKRLDKLDEKARRLEPGDTIFIDSISVTFREVFDIATTTALIAATIMNVILAYRYRN
jgi:protein involved in polysaccharide export with SLBB domain